MNTHTPTIQGGTVAHTVIASTLAAVGSDTSDSGIKIPAKLLTGETVYLGPFANKATADLWLTTYRPCVDLDDLAAQAERGDRF